MFDFFSNGLIIFVVLLVGVGAAYVWHKTSKATIVADKFFLLLRQGQFEEARALSTPAFQQFTSLQELRVKAQLSGLIDTAPTAWINRQIGKERAILAGGFRHKDDSYLPVAIQLNEIGKNWLVNGVELSPRIGRSMRRDIDIRIDSGFKVITPPASSDSSNILDN